MSEDPREANAILKQDISSSETLELRQAAIERGGYLFFLFTSFLMALLAIRVVCFQVSSAASDDASYARRTTRVQNIHSRRGSILSQDGVVLAQDRHMWRIAFDPKAFRIRRKPDLTEEEIEKKNIPIAEQKPAALFQKYIADFPREIFNDRTSDSKIVSMARKALVNNEPGSDKKAVRYIPLGDIYEEKDKDKYLAWHKSWCKDNRNRGGFLNIELLSRRQINFGRLARQVIGVVKPSDQSGLSGIEAQFQNYLAGRNGFARVQKGHGQRRYRLQPNWGAGAAQVNAQLGANVRLTINSMLQSALEQELQEVYEARGAKSAYGIVVDIHSGAILAMANAPLLDIDKLSSLEGEELNAYALQCRGKVMDSGFEVGSTMKSVVAAWVLYKNYVGLNDVLSQGEERARVMGARIEDAIKHKGPVDLETAIVESSNICLAKLGQILGFEGLHDCLDSFGFREKTGLAGGSLEYNGKAVIDSRLLDSRSKHDLARMPFGYAFNVGLLQLARAYCGIVNNGRLPALHLVEAVENSPGEWKHFPADDFADESHFQNRAQAERMSTQMRSTLRKVVERSSHLISPEMGEPIGFAGKSGTAHPYDKKLKTYNKKLRNSLFVGFAPADNPQFLTVIIVEGLKEKPYYGSRVAGPIARRVLGMALGKFDQRREKRFQSLLQQGKNKAY